MSSPHFSPHLILHLSLISFVPHVPEAVQECERSGTCWCVLLCSSVRPGHQSHFILLQRANHTADVRLPQGTHKHIHPAEAFKRHLALHIFYFFRSASDDRYGSAVSDKWLSVPARTWCEWLRSSHWSHTPTLGEDLPSSLLHHDGLLQQHLQVRHTLRRTLRVLHEYFQWPERVCSLRVAALKLQPRVEYWEHSNDHPPYWFGNIMGQMMHPITRPI